ncbi:MAG TPA: sigma-70 family RNA polymerase sigma factor [Firmicutes bacterium]|nr:sigma-70 family RNA polymerase sigma factor [Bacillota bacterium]
MVIKAKAGDDKARERLIASSRPFIQQVTSWCSRRRLDWHADELSIALLAFNEAIDSYDPNRGAQFLSFARLVISGRLTDYRRRNKAAGKEVPLTLVGPDGSESVRPEVVTAAEEALLKEQARRERAEEIAVFTAELATYDLSLNDIEQACPRHRNRRQKLLGVAAVLAKNPELMARVRSTGQLPLKELAQLTGLNRKVLERGRRYILAVSLILSNPEYVHLAFYVTPARGR